MHRLQHSANSKKVVWVDNELVDFEKQLLLIIEEKQFVAVAFSLFPQS